MGIILLWLRGGGNKGPFGGTERMLHKVYEVTALGSRVFLILYRLGPGCEQAFRALDTLLYHCPEALHV